MSYHDPYAPQRQPRFIPHEPPTAQQPQAAGWPAPPPQHAYAQRPPAAPRKKRRVFWWVFLAVQVLFVIWLISAGFATDQNVTHCHAQYLSSADCKNAAAAGSAIGIGLIVVFWVAVDFLLAIPYAIYRLATRR